MAWTSSAAMSAGFAAVASTESTLGCEGLSFPTLRGIRGCPAGSAGGGFSKGHVAGKSWKGSSLRSQRRGRSLIAMSGKQPEEAIPCLNDLPLIPYINQQGRIQPQIEKTTKASVFGVFDENKKLQYIGFSKDVRNSLRTLMGRRPEVCHYFKLYNLDSLDQARMLACRQQWVSELGLPPVGLADPVQKNLWEQPADAGSISERGRGAAAVSKSKAFLQIMADRGLKEEMVYDPALLEAGQCDVLPSADQSADEIAKANQTYAEEAARRRKTVVTSPSGEEIEFEIYFEFKFPTNGGWMYDILVTKDDKETRHRVICGRIYPESINMPEDRFVEIIMGFLLYKKVPRRTEGLMSGDMFPINYFAVSEVAQRFDDMKDWFTGGELPETYWRFNRIHSYGPSADTPPSLGPENVLLELIKQKE